MTTRRERWYLICGGLKSSPSFPVHVNDIQFFVLVFSEPKCVPITQLIHVIMPRSLLFSAWGQQVCGQRYRYYSGPFWEIKPSYFLCDRALFSCRVSVPTHTQAHTHPRTIKDCCTVIQYSMFTPSDMHQFTVNSLPLAHTQTHTQTHSSQVKLQPFSNQETSTGTIMVNFSPKPAGRYFRTAGASQAKRNDFPQDFWISFAIRHKLIRSDMISSTIRKQLPSNSVGRGNPCKWIAANCALQRCMITVLYKTFKKINKKRLEFTLKQGGLFFPPSF